MLLLHLVLAVATVFIVGVMVMGTANCAYVECGDQRWANRAWGSAILGSGALLVINVVASVWRMAVSRPALPVALSGCGLQLALWLTCLVMLDLAGPIS